MSEDNVTSITIVNNVSVTVPASPKLMTNFVLQEQNDWFEDEIGFMRYFIKPGMRVVDIGANYGLYTLTIANIIGDSGKIWAFEPTKATAECLKKSIVANNFKNTKLIQFGLSDRIGKAKFYTSQNSELNSLSKDANSNLHTRTEKISLLTLDHCMHKYAWNDIDFIKIDAEGEEANILKKGKKTLSSLSPLIMFELKHGENINLSLINRFKNMGYDSYRLIPGLNTLIPFDHNEPFDGFLLNLFCCKEDRAKLLESEGIIVRSWVEKNTNNDSLAQEYIGKLAYSDPLNPYIFTAKVDGSDKYLEILNSYIMSLSKTASSSDRVGYLMNSLKNLRSMVEKGEQRIERLVTFSRIAFDAGERSFGVRILSNLIDKYSTNINYKINELFLPASQRYDSISPNAKINEWLFSSILEKCIEKHHYSSYFTQKSTLPLFDKLNDLGFIGEDMRRRHHLVKDCFLR